ncbi:MULTISPECIES: NAD-dependent epimerase/dehydratase family protein [Priestia]|uniref:NAD-dependent epimerase/dehydratase family protein n=1 Tax=Priestia TaxID=2800373 RepID=UPI0011A279CA|nr:NAD-dependent epimerase/dehydratase family protein [Priestia flexa]
MKVLVTGGTGFIGSHVVECLLENGYTPVVLDNLSSGIRSNLADNVSFYNMSILSKEIEQVFKIEKPEVVIHLAAQVNVSTSLKAPVEDAATNILGTINLLDMCKKHAVKKFIFSSSSAVYGDADTVIDEETPTSPLSFYGTSKLVSESYIQLFQRLHGLSFTIFRYANVFGPRQKSDGEGGVISIFINQLLNGKTPSIFGTGNQTRDFVFVEDVAKANVLAIKSGENEIINISCNHQISINELFKLLAAEISSSATPNYLPGQSGEILHSQLNNQKALQTLGWKPSSDIHTHLLKTIEHFQSYRS